MTAALAEMQTKNQNYERAAELYLTNYKWRRLSLEKSESLIFGESLIDTYRYAGKPEKAVEIGTEVVATARQVLGADDPKTLILEISLARAKTAVGDTTGALQLAAQTLERCTSTLGADNGISCDAQAAYYEALMKQEDYPAAEQVARELFDIVKDAKFTNTLRLSLSANMISEAQLRQGNTIGAQQLLSAISSALNAEFPEHTLTAATNILLGETYLEQQDYAKAESELVKGYDSLTGQIDKLSADDNQLLNRARQLLAKLYEATGQTDKAASYQTP
jgi:hypothetical protein